MSIAASLCAFARAFQSARGHRSVTRGAVSPSSRLLTRLLGSDPGLLRFHTALRSAIACVLTGVVTIGWTVHTHQPPTLAAFALLFAMVAPLFLRDASPRGWFRSLAVIYIAGSASLIAASTLAAWPLVADTSFLAVLFAAILVQACGPRALGGAMTAVVSFYLGLYLHPTLAHVCAMLWLSTIALASVTFTGRVLVPTRPEVTLRRALTAVMQRATTVLADRRADEPNAMRHLSLLNEAALAVEEQLGLLDLSDAQRLRACLIDVEVAAGQHAVDASRLDRSDVRLRVALRRLSRAGRDAVALTTRAAKSGVKRSTGVALVWRDALSWLPACRATTAALIAMLIGHSVSPERWFWAVITTFVVFLGTRSRGDTIRKTGERVLGTLAGVAVSAALLDALHGTPWLLVAAMAACVFGWAYFILTSYGQGVFFITVLVGLIYGELGFAIGPLIEMRVEEVFVGCVVSIAVAVSMMPLRTSHHVDVKVTGVLDALDDLLRVCNPSPDGLGLHPLVAMRALDRRWHELRVALRPLQTQRVFAWNTQLELAVGPLFACVQAARELAREVASETARGAAVAATDEARARLAGAMAMFAARSGRSIRDSHAAVSGDLIAAR